MWCFPSWVCIVSYRIVLSSSHWKVEKCIIFGLISSQSYNIRAYCQLEYAWFVDSIAIFESSVIVEICFCTIASYCCSGSLFFLPSCELRVASCEFQTLKTLVNSFFALPPSFETGMGERIYPTRTPILVFGPFWPHFSWISSTPALGLSELSPIQQPFTVHFQIYTTIIRWLHSDGRWLRRDGRWLQTIIIVYWHYKINELVRKCRHNKQ